MYDLIQSAHQVGVIFKVCAPSVDRWGDNFIAEVTGIVGSAYLVGEAIDDETVTY